MEEWAAHELEREASRRCPLGGGRGRSALNRLGWSTPARAFTTADWEFNLELFNLLNSDDDDIAYYYESRLAGEPAGGIADFHFHPLEPRTLRATIALRL